MIDILPLVEQTKWGDLYRWSEQILIHIVAVSEGLTQSQNEELVVWLNAKRQSSQVVNLWEDVLSDNFELVQARLHAMSGTAKRIHGRLTKVHQVDEDEAKRFFGINHIQGHAGAATYYGLRYQDNWVAMASFGQPRLMSRDYDHPHLSGELIRFCNRAGYRVYGGLDKLLKYYLREHQVDDVMTYSDLDWSDGGSFEKLDFQMKGTKPPMAFALVDGKRSVCPNPLWDMPYCWNSGSLKWVRYCQRDQKNQRK
jgi:hypothetical protein